MSFLTRLALSSNRSYNALDGRFTSQDLKRFSAGDVNLYRYVANEPIILIDPSGLDADASRKRLILLEIRDDLGDNGCPASGLPGYVGKAIRVGELVPEVGTLHDIQAAHANDPTLKSMMGYLDTAILNAQPLFDRAYAETKVAWTAWNHAWVDRTWANIDKARQDVITASNVTDAAYNQLWSIRRRIKRVWDYLYKAYGISPPSPPNWPRDVPRQT
jgi:hypothetical protein